MELGGNAPLVVFEDADLERAARLAVASALRNAGQTCICANRILVHDSVYDRFAEIATQVRGGSTSSFLLCFSGFCLIAASVVCRALPGCFLVTCFCPIRTSGCLLATCWANARYLRGPCSGNGPQGPTAVQVVSKIKVGHGIEEGTTMGPLIRQSDVDKAEAFVKDAVASGAKVLIGGTRCGALLW